MAVEFKNSETKDNLMRAFAGESQARNRYTFAAAQARMQNEEVIAQLFEYTANQEKEHAEVFYKHLKELAGETISVDGGYPVDITDDLSQLLKMASHNEYEEANSVYQAFGDKAKEEGFMHVASTFYMIARIEKTHGERFERFAGWMEEEKLHKSDRKRHWLCLNCGFVHEVDQAPGVCPVCQHEQGYFIRMEQSPFM